jgi:alpha-amylase/alpha-mannosidase (GH57 family)
MSKKKMKFVLCWHMHQPWYRESRDGRYQLPWVYLHAVKDYADMASHLETHPGMRVVVNFTPVLLEQIDDYAQRMNAWLDSGVSMSEPLLDLLAGVDAIPEDAQARAWLLQACTRAHGPSMIDIYPEYREMLDHAMIDGATPRWSLLPYLSSQFFLDLLTWYHISWLGYSVRQQDVVKSLIGQARMFTHDDHRELIRVMRDTISGLIRRYRRLAELGQIELSMTPYAHPILPLLIDFDAMECSQPEAPKPDTGHYPGGIERSRWHLLHGLEVFDSYFGRRPDGVWLGEGAVSDASVRLLDEMGISWTASGEGVWSRSLDNQLGRIGKEPDRRSLFMCHQLPETRTRIFFRDDGLSDLIGFEYQQWDARAAADDFIGHLRNIASFVSHEVAGQVDEHVVSVILDGENAWEYYTDNAHHFLDALYAGLTSCDVIEPVTFSEAAKVCHPSRLESLCAGSWVYGSFSTWIGEKDKNRAWDCLVRAKRRYDEVTRDLPHDSPAHRELERQLAICEGSDWFWWFGDYNPAESVRDFDRLYRRQLADLYLLLGDVPPEELEHPISAGGGHAELGGTMRRGGEN